MLVRIGINIGEVIVDGDDIYGDGVNVAARLQELAEPGGVTISANVQEQVEGKHDERFEDAGAHEVKGIARPIHVWRWPAAGAAQAPLALPEKPSIAILPFDNMSSDPEQVFFAEGIAEDIITELSKFHSLFVIARNSSFSFKGQALEVKEIGRRLGVRYIVEGSVRRAGNRVRITAQLIDAVSDTHLWAERYDRDLEDIFAVQDEVTHAIVTTIEPHLADTERQRARRKPPDSLDAWASYQRGLWHLFQYTRDDIRPIWRAGITHVYDGGAVGQVQAELDRSVAELADLRFAWKAAKHVKSNAIVVAKEKATVGIGGGQQNRKTPVELALRLAGEKAKGGVLASDAFFPFARDDAVEMACRAGVTAIIQPGGAVRDEEAIEVCDEYGVAMVFTGERHFRH